MTSKAAARPIAPTIEMPCRFMTNPWGRIFTQSTDRGSERQARSQLNATRAQRSAGQAAEDRRIGQRAGRVIEVRTVIDRRPLIGVERVVQLHPELQPTRAAKRHVLENREIPVHVSG